MVSVSIGIEESNLAVRSEGEEREEEVRNEGKKKEREDKTKEKGYFSEVSMLSEQLFLFFVRERKRSQTGRQRKSEGKKWKEK